MTYLLLIVLLLLFLSLFVSVIKSESWTKKIKGFRIIVSVIALLFTTFLFLQASISLSSSHHKVKISNRLPQGLDFYILQPSQDQKSIDKIQHVGEIRPDYFRKQDVALIQNQVFWIVGYLGQNMAYFSKNIFNSKEGLQEVDVNFYRLPKTDVLQQIELAIQQENHLFRDQAIVVSLILLLLFLNLVLLLRKKTS